MSKMTDEAIARMAEEIKGKDHLIPFEEYLTEICTTDAVAEKILDKGRSLQGAFKAMEDIARKRKTGNCAYIPPEEGYQIIRDYYGINDKDMAQPGREHAGSIDVLDFL